MSSLQKLERGAIFFKFTITVREVDYIEVVMSNKQQQFYEKMKETITSTFTL